MTRAVVVSDIHLLYAQTEVDAFLSLIDYLESDPPDELILNGDLLELWRNDLAGVMWLASDFLDMLEKLEEGGVGVTYVQGNHDDYLARHLDFDKPYDFEPQLNYRTTFDGVRYFFTHGHKYEPTYAPPTNTFLARTDDHTGSLSTRLWESRPAPGNPVENAALAALGPAGSYLNPENIKTNEARLVPIEYGIRFETAEDEWGIFGHTHTPYVSPDERIANTGSMTAGQATFIEIEDGTPTLRSAFDDL
jgi:predicted phosphodiesterase